MSFFSAIFGKSASSSGSSGTGGGARSQAAAVGQGAPASRSRPSVNVNGSFTGDDAKAQIQSKMELIAALNKKIELSEEEVKRDKLAALEKNKAGNKKAAMILLKKANDKQTAIEGLYTQIANMEQMVDAIKNQEVNKRVVDELDRGAHFIGKNKVDREVAEDVHERVEEAINTANETRDVLSQPIGGGSTFDEDELAAQLAEMELEQEAEAASAAPAHVATQQATGTSLAMPSVPKGPVARAAAPAQKTDEELLAELQREMAAN